MWRTPQKLSTTLSVIPRHRLLIVRSCSGQAQKDGPPSSKAAEGTTKPKAPEGAAKPKAAEGAAKSKAPEVAAAPKAPEVAAAPKAAPPPPPPPPSSGGGGWFWKLLGVTVVGAGGVIGYAWYDPKFRSQIEDNVPYSKPSLDMLMGYLDDAIGKQDTPALPSTAPAGLESKEKGLAKVIRPQVDEEKKTKDVKKTTKEKALDARDEARRAVEEKKRKDKEHVRQQVLEREAEEAAENAALETILAGMISEVMEASLEATEAQKRAAQATRAHTKQLKKAMDEADSTKKEAEWSGVTQAFSARKDAVESAERVTETARMALEKLEAAVKEGRDNAITKKNKVLIGAEETLSKANYDLYSAVGQFEKAKSEATLMKEYRDLVQKGKDQFRQELESVLPDVKIKRRVGGKMTEDELNSLIAHAHRRIEQLQRQLAEQQALERLRMQEAIDKQEQEDEKIGDFRVSLEQQRLRSEFEVEKQKLDAESSVKFERELRHQLSRQAAAHSDHLAEVLKVQEQELQQRFEALLHDRTVDERDRLRGEVKHWTARMQGIEAALEGRAELDKQSRKAQELWLACQSLQRIIVLGREDTEEGQNHLKPLANELVAIKEAGDNQPFVNTVISTIPDDAIQRGVWTQDGLYDRFGKVRKLCKRVAMIDETGGTLFRYLMSVMQSWLVFSASKPVAENEEIIPEELHTFAILDNAAYYLEKGDLEQTLRFLNQLRGESRRVASDWIKEARLLLETRQAADALLAHASANGLGSLFEVK